MCVRERDCDCEIESEFVMKSECVNLCEREKEVEKRREIEKEIKRYRKGER